MFVKDRLDLLEGRRIQEPSVARAVVERRASGEKDVLGADFGPTVQSRHGPSGLRNDDVRPLPIHLEVRAGCRDGEKNAIGDLDLAQAAAGLDQACAQGILLSREKPVERSRIALEEEVSLHDLDPLPRVAHRLQPDAEREPIQDLRAEVPLLRIHRADQNEFRRVRDRQPFPLDRAPVAGGRVQDVVDQMIGQEIDLIHVEDVPVGRAEDAHLHLALARMEQGLDVDAADQTVFRAAQREIDDHHPPVPGGKGRCTGWSAGRTGIRTRVRIRTEIQSLATQRTKTLLTSGIAVEGAAVDRRILGKQIDHRVHDHALSRALRPADEEAADLGIHDVGQIDRLERVLAHHRAERKMPLRLIHGGLLGSSSSDRRPAPDRQLFFEVMGTNALTF